MIAAALLLGIISLFGVWSGEYYPILRDSTLLQWEAVDNR
jgi:hypothetical protein